MSNPTTPYVVLTHLPVSPEMTSVKGPRIMIPLDHEKEMFSAKDLAEMLNVAYLEGQRNPLVTADNLTLEQIKELRESARNAPGGGNLAIVELCNLAIGWVKDGEAESDIFKACSQVAEIINLRRSAK